MTDIKNKFKILGEECQLATEIPTEGSDALVTSGQIHDTLTSKLQSVLGVPLVDSWDTNYAAGIPTIGAIEEYVNSITGADTSAIIDPHTRHPMFPAKQNIFQGIKTRLETGDYDAEEGLTEDFKGSYQGQTFFINSTTKKQLYGGSDNTSINYQFIYIDETGGVYVESPEPWVIYYNNESGEFCRWNPADNNFISL